MHSFKEDYFSNVDTPDKAYYLGLMYSDGNIYLKRNRVQISLQNRDSYILEELLTRTEHSGRLYSDRGLYSSFVIHSKKMVSDLEKLGCTSNKCFTISFPKFLPENLNPHFIRGFFDGDGTIGFNKNGTATVSITSNEEFLMGLSRFLEDKIGIKISSFRKRYKEKEHSSGDVRFSGKEKVEKFYKYIYNNSENLRILRKYEVMKEYANS